MIIISRCPYRVSLLGGSSDLDWYVNQNNYGISVGFSLKLYTRVILSYKESSDRGILNYSSREEYNDIDSISHPIIRTCLKKFNVKKKVELCSIAESISGLGLGSSSSFSVALIKAITKLNSLNLTNKEIAHHASEVEIIDLNKPIGRQDQYLCALGGVNVLGFRPKGEVKIYNQPTLSSVIENFSKKLYLVNTYKSRSATKTLLNLKKEKSTVDSINNLRNITTKFIEMSKNLNQKDIEELLKLQMKNAWEIKRKMHGVMTKELLDIEKRIIRADFSILKLLGAGGGGYFLVLFNGKVIENSKSELENSGLDLKKIEICNEGCSSCIF
tara:strand:+ start:1616 stop:2602 length:987 start_codon:yes stop_codon:yes gene_type:complete